MAQEASIIRATVLGPLCPSSPSTRSSKRVHAVKVCAPQIPTVARSRTLAVYIDAKKGGEGVESEGGVGPRTEGFARVGQRSATRHLYPARPPKVSPKPECSHTIRQTLSSSLLYVVLHQKHLQRRRFEQGRGEERVVRTGVTQMRRKQERNKGRSTPRWWKHCFSFLV